MTRYLVARATLIAVAAVAVCGTGARASVRQPFSAPFVIGHADDHAPGITPPLRLLGTASTGSGALALAWTSTPPGGTTRIELARREPDGPLLQARPIFRSSDLRGQPALAMDAHGDTLVVFTVASPRRVMVVDVTASGHVGHARTISPPGAPAEMPAVAETPAGAAVVVFERDTAAGSADEVMASTRPIGGHFSAAASISPPQSLSGAPVAAVAGDGTMTVAWNISVPAGTAVQPQVQVATAPAGGGFGEPTSPIDCASFGLTLAGDATGDSLLSCQGSDMRGGYSELAAARDGATATFGAAAELPQRWDLIDAATALGLNPARRGLVVTANGDGDHAGVLQTASWMPGQSAPVLGRTIAQAKPVAKATFGGYTYPSTPAIAFVHGRPVVAWGEGQPENDGRDGSGRLAAVTPEFASGATSSTIGPGRLLARAAYPADEDLDAFVLVGGGSGRLYAAWLSGGTVYASRLISLH